MQRPADTATDADRVEWLQLNLLIQFQTVYKQVPMPGLQPGTSSRQGTGFSPFAPLLLRQPFGRTSPRMAGGLSFPLFALWPQ